MAEDKLLSVSIAAYNAQDYLGCTLESLMGAKLRDQLDVIVVNDGSSDKTSAIGHEFETRYPGIVRVIDKANAGYGSTINASLECAVGKYYKLLDGDDWVDPCALDALLRSLGEHGEDVVVTPYNIVQDGTSVVEEVRVDGRYGCRDVPLLSAMGDTAFPMHALAYKTKLLVDNHISITERCYYTDYEFTVKPMLYAETVAFVDANVYQYRIGREGQSVSLESIKRNIDMAITASLKLADFYEDEVKDSAVCSEKKAILLKQIASSTRNKYQMLLLLDSVKDAREKMLAYDLRLKETSSIVYTQTVGTPRMKKVIWAMNFCGGVLLPVVSRAVKMKNARG